MAHLNANGFISEPAYAFSGQLSGSGELSAHRGTRQAQRVTST